MLLLLACLGASCWRVRKWPKASGFIEILEQYHTVAYGALALCVCCGGDGNVTTCEKREVVARRGNDSSLAFPPSADHKRKSLNLKQQGMLSQAPLSVSGRGRSLGEALSGHSSLKRPLLQRVKGWGPAGAGATPKSGAGNLSYTLACLCANHPQPHHTNLQPAPPAMCKETRRDGSKGAYTLLKGPARLCHAPLPPLCFWREDNHHETSNAI